MVVEVGISRSNKLSRDGVAEENAEDAVLDGVGLILIKGNENQSVFHEFRVGKERLQEGAEPLEDGGVSINSFDCLRSIQKLGANCSEGLSWNL